ncbi:MAG TPA: hypothetical protein VKW04_12900 [Planctomycetota bacterium]|nr:hypothetical protein [Planctomycetota bacterium]
MSKPSDGTLMLLLSVLAVGLLFTLIRMSRGPAVFETVVVIFVLSGLGGAAFLLGGAHARQRRERRDPPPPPPPA